MGLFFFFSYFYFYFLLAAVLVGGCFLVVVAFGVLVLLGEDGFPTGLDGICLNYFLDILISNLLLFFVSFFLFFFFFQIVLTEQSIATSLSGGKFRNRGGATI